MADHFTEATLFKVYKALRATGLTEQQAEDAINEMQNAGILFRERPERKSQMVRAARRGSPYPDSEDDDD